MLVLITYNSSIQRVIFETMTKYDGESVKVLEVPHIKQIGGRAGRYRVAPSLPLKNSEAKQDQQNGDIPAVIPPVGPLPAMPNPGIVTTFEKDDLKILKLAMKAEVPPIETAGILPPDRMMEKFAMTYPPRKPFSQILERMFSMTKVNKNLFHLCAVDDLMRAAGVVEATRGLTVRERITITQAPLPRRDDNVKKSLIAYSNLIAESKSGSILDVRGLEWDVLDKYLEEKDRQASECQDNSSRSEELKKLWDQVTTAEKEGFLQSLPRLESLHKSTMLWLWLSYVPPPLLAGRIQPYMLTLTVSISYRFPSVFTPRETAFDLKQITEDAIQDILNKTNYNRAKKMRNRKKAELLGAFGGFDGLLSDDGTVSNPWEKESERRQVVAGVA